MTRKAMVFNKSVIRHTILDKFPDSGFQGDKCRVTKIVADIVFIDLMQYIKTIEPRKSNNNTSEQYVTEDGIGEGADDYGGAINLIVSKILRAINVSRGSDSQSKYINQSENDKGKPLTVVVTLDKYDYVCGARSIVHGKRKSNDKNDGRERVEAGEFRRPSIDDPMTYTFAQITEDKKYNSRVLFEFVISSVIEELDRLDLKRDINFIFDGHCIENESMYFLPHFNAVVVEDCYSTPLLFEYRKDKSQRVTRWLSEMYNTIGEGDFMPYYYITNYDLFNLSEERQEDGVLNVDIFSIDTDSLLYTMIYIAMLNIKNIYNVKISLGYEGFKKGSTMKWVDMNKLVKMVDNYMSKSGGSMIQYPSLQLAIASLAVGSDYTERHDQFPQNHFVKAYLDYSYNIGDIVDVKEDGDEFYRLKLRGNEYTRYIAMGYVVGKMKNKAWHTFDPNHYRREKLYIAVREKMVKEYPLNHKFWLPSNEDLILSAKQFQYYINMMSRIGDSTVDIELQDSNMELYGYKYISEPDTDRLIMVRDIHTYNEDEFIEVASSILGIKAVDKLLDKEKEKKRKAQEAPKEKKKSAKRVKIDETKNECKMVHKGRYSLEEVVEEF